MGKHRHRSRERSTKSLDLDRERGVSFTASFAWGPFAWRWCRGRVMRALQPHSATRNSEGSAMGLSEFISANISAIVGEAVVYARTLPLWPSNQKRRCETLFSRSWMPSFSTRTRGNLKRNRVPNPSGWQRRCCGSTTAETHGSPREGGCRSHSWLRSTAHSAQASRALG
jgi:hypothetical protein